MVFKLKLLPWLLLSTALAAPGVRAENCRLWLSQSRIDYGGIRREVFVERAAVTLGTRSLNLNVVCTAPTVMALRFNGVAADAQGFRFGHLGRFRLSLKHAQVDGRAVEGTAAHLSGEPVGGQLLPGQAWVAWAAGVAVVGRRMTALVDIDTDLPSAALDVRGETGLEGQGSFELVSPVVPPSQ